MAKIDEILLLAREYEATDIYMTAGMPLQYRVNGKLLRAPIQPSEKEVEDTIYEILICHRFFCGRYYDFKKNRYRMANANRRFRRMVAGNRSRVRIHRFASQ